LNFSRLRSRTRLTSQTSDDAGNVFDEEPNYTGLCLPDDLAKIFSFENEQVDADERRASNKLKPSFKTHLDKISNDSLAVNNGLELHNDLNCLQCVLIRSKTSDTVTEKGPSDALKVPHIGEVQRKVSLTKHIELDVPSSSLTSSSSAELGHGRSCDPLSSQILIRREVLRFITNLSGSVAARAAEQGLLNLKQKYPMAFQDICLYSEVSLQMSTYNFRLQARRFIQELFMDLGFEQLKLHSEDLVRQKVFPKRSTDHVLPHNPPLLHSN
jgi:rapamycin-insensitive companion of mTOR